MYFSNDSSSEGHLFLFFPFRSKYYCLAVLPPSASPAGTCLGALLEGFLLFLPSFFTFPPNRKKPTEGGGGRRDGRDANGMKKVEEKKKGRNQFSLPL